MPAQNPAQCEPLPAPPRAEAGVEDLGRPRCRLILSSMYYSHVLWMDPCHCIVPGSPKTQYDQQQASYGKGPRWMSPDQAMDSRNLRSSPYAGKQCQWGDVKLWWFIVLCRGKVHAEIMDDGWRQDGEGQAQMVAKLPNVLRRMFGRDAKPPEYIFSDRGPGFYHSSTGGIFGNLLGDARLPIFAEGGGYCANVYP